MRNEEVVYHTFFEFTFQCGICGYAVKSKEAVEAVADALRHVREKHTVLYERSPKILDVILAAVKREAPGPGS